MKKTAAFAAVLVLVCACRTINPTPEGSWKLSYIVMGNGVLLEPRGVITMIFASDRSVGGQAACNSYGGQYSFEDSTISFSDIVSTMALCPEGSGDQEFFSGLQLARSYIRTDTSLVIRSQGSVAEMNFRQLTGR